MDVNSLYTNIQHSDGVEACCSFLTMTTTDQTLVNDIPTLVDFILKHNRLVFDDEQYLKINGTAMGTKMAPTYDNVFMYYIENTFLSSFNLKPAAYFRYIDDIFLIWPHGIDTLQTFLDNANRTHPNISFTHEYSSTAVSFLDVIIKINNGIISTRLYKKTTDNHRYLNYTSCHPMHIKNSIIFSQLLRYKRICSDRKDFIKHSKELVTHFLHIGYPIKAILNQWDKVYKVHRASLFTHREKPIDNHIPLVQTYHPTIVSTNKSVIKEWKLYSNINSANHLFCNSPVCAYRQPPNLKRMLVKSNLSRISTLIGNSKYMKPRCQVYDILDTRNKLQIPGTSSTILPGNYNCDSCNIVYLLMCSKCDSGNYIGETSNRLRLRLNNHKKSIRDNSRCFPEAVHFNQPDHSLMNLRCVILRGDFKTTADRLIYEQTLIYKLKSHSKGVNQDLSFLSPYSYFHQCCCC